MRHCHSSPLALRMLHLCTRQNLQLCSCNTLAASRNISLRLAPIQASTVVTSPPMTKSLAYTVYATTHLRVSDKRRATAISVQLQAALHVLAEEATLIDCTLNQRKNPRRPAAPTQARRAKRRTGSARCPIRLPGGWLQPKRACAPAEQAGSWSCLVSPLFRFLRKRPLRAPNVVVVPERSAGSSYHCMPVGLVCCPSFMRDCRPTGTWRSWLASMPF
jgi:hypothetical protein